MPICTPIAASIAPARRCISSASCATTGPRRSPSLPLTARSAAAGRGRGRPAPDHRRPARGVPTHLSAAARRADRQLARRVPPRPEGAAGRDGRIPRRGFRAAAAQGGAVRRRRADRAGRALFRSASRRATTTARPARVCRSRPRRRSPSTKRRSRPSPVSGSASRRRNSPAPGRMSRRRRPTATANRPPRSP